MVALILFMLGITNLLCGIINVMAAGTTWIYCFSFFVSGFCFSGAMYNLCN